MKKSVLISISLLALQSYAYAGNSDFGSSSPISSTLVSQIGSRQIFCTKDHQVYAGNYQESFSLEVGNRFGGSFRAQGHRYAWTILPDGTSAATADCDGFVCAAVYRCSVQ